MEEALDGVLGRDLTKALERILNEFVRLNYGIKEIYSSVKGLNDISIMGLYLLATKRKDNMSYYIKEAYDRILNLRVSGFKRSVKNNTYINYLNKLEKNSVVNLAYHMNLYNLGKDEIEFLSRNNKRYYKILNDYIKNMV